MRRRLTPGLRPKLAGTVSLWLLLFELGGCTGDPNQGGIFWSESKANDRLAARRAALTQARQDAAHDNVTNDRLRQQHDDLRTKVADQRAELARIDTDLVRLRADARGSAAGSVALRGQLQQVENLRAALHSTDQPMDAAEIARQEQELARLRTQVAQLKVRDELLQQTR